MDQPRSARATSSSASESAEGQCADLLEGVDLAPAVRAQALAIVTSDAAARRDLVAHHPHRFWDQIAMIATRDAAIRALLSTDDQRTRFDANVARWNSIRAAGS
jgi:secreted trypsin-like serine protease